MEKFQIGIATLNFDLKGKPKSATFEPTMTISSSEEVVNSLKAVKCDDVQGIKDNAEIVMAEWFKKLNDIELADRDTYEIVSNVLDLDYNGKGKVRKIMIAFEFQKINSSSNQN